MRHTLCAFIALIAQTDSITIEAEADLEDINVYYDYDGSDSGYAVHLETGMYGEGSEFAYKDDVEIHLDGSCPECKSKMFYMVPDAPPEDDGVTWLDPY